MCLSHLIYTVRPCLIHTCHAMPMPCPYHALTMPLFSRARHSTAAERRPVGYLQAFGFFRLPREFPRRFLSEAYQSSSQRSIPTTVKSGSSKLQKRRSVGLAVRIFPATTRTFTKDMALSEHGRGAAWHVWINGTAWQGNGMGTACNVCIGLCSDASCVSSATHTPMSPHAAHRSYRTSYRNHWWCVRLVIFGPIAKTDMGVLPCVLLKWKHINGHKYPPPPLLYCPWTLKGLWNHTQSACCQRRLPLRTRKRTEDRWWIKGSTRTSKGRAKYHKWGTNMGR